MRVPAAAGFVLIGHPHQPRQALQVFHAGDGVVHPGVAGVLVQVRHRGLDCFVVGGGQHLLGHLVGQGPDQGDALGGGEGQIESVHALGGECPPPLTVGGDAVVQPGRRHLRVDGTASQGAVVQAAQSGDDRLVAGDQPGRGPGVGLGIVFA
jgi:hypothetical protein